LCSRAQQEQDAMYVATSISSIRPCHALYSHYSHSVVRVRATHACSKPIGLYSRFDVSVSLCVRSGYDFILVAISACDRLTDWHNSYLVWPCLLSYTVLGYRLSMFATIVIRVTSDYRSTRNRLLLLADDNATKTEDPLDRHTLIQWAIG